MPLKLQTPGAQGQVSWKGFITVAGHAMNTQHSHVKNKIWENPSPCASLFTLQGALLSWGL